jgi:hypothetical protein
MERSDDEDGGLEDVSDEHESEDDERVGKRPRKYGGIVAKMEAYPMMRGEMPDLVKKVGNLHRKVGQPLITLKAPTVAGYSTTIGRLAQYAKAAPDENFLSVIRRVDSTQFNPECSASLACNDHTPRMLRLCAAALL